MTQPPTVRLTHRLCDGKEAASAEDMCWSWWRSALARSSRRRQSRRRQVGSIRDAAWDRLVPKPRARSPAGPEGRRQSEIPARVRAELDAGTRAAADLAEILAVDFLALMRSAVPQVARAATRSLEDVAGAGITARMAVAGDILRDAVDDDGLRALARHPSDTVRGWVAYALGQKRDVPLELRLARMRPFADDGHFGVREWAWLAVRPEVADDPLEAIRVLTSWTGEAAANLRRFAVEATRPRGVWSRHIPALKDRPECGLPLIEPLRSDVSRYVQDSVSNWLNDAAKSRPSWVQALCRSWSKASLSSETLRICRRAVRSL